MEIYDRGARLKALREKRGFLQAQVVKRLDVTRSTISAYERNTKTFSVEVLEGLAILYRSSIDYILGLDRRRSLYIYDLTESQQETVETIVNVLRNQFKRESNYRW